MLFDQMRVESRFYEASVASVANIVGRPGQGVGNLHLNKKDRQHEKLAGRCDRP
jgi:hypothetical protein